MNPFTPEERYEAARHDIRHASLKWFLVGIFFGGCVVLLILASVLR